MYDIPDKLLSNISPRYLDTDFNGSSNSFRIVKGYSTFVWNLKNGDNLFRLD